MTIYPCYSDKFNQRFIQKCLDCKELDSEWKEYIIENNKNKMGEREEKIGNNLFFYCFFFILYAFIYIVYLILS